MIYQDEKFFPRSMSFLKIPYALDVSGVMVAPNDARKGNRYSCPECREMLVLRTGAIRAPHFSHRGKSEDCKFLNESSRHLAAKHAVLFVVGRWKKRKGGRPEIRRRCPVCGEEKTQKLPRKVARAALEYRWETDRENTTVVADVALLDGKGNPLAFVEIRDSHAVNDEKRDRMGVMPWIELDAHDVLDNPYMWKPIQSGNLKKFSCKCDIATKMPIICRGLALHVDYCPTSARVWRGKPYANVVDDCTQCVHCVGESHGEGKKAGSGPRFLYCMGFHEKKIK